MKKKILNSICIILSILIILSAVSVYVINRYSLSVSQGLFLLAENNAHMLVQMNSPIKMNNLTDNEKLFESLSDGDEILVIHDGVQESYPGATRVYAVFKLNDGDISDISKNVLASLSELGWWKDKDKLPDEQTTQTTNTGVNNEQKPTINRPPELQVLCENVMVKGWLGTYSWFFENADGTMQAITADSAHPSEVLDDIHPLPLTSPLNAPEKTFYVSLFFENIPDSISVRRYNITKDRIADISEYTEIPVTDFKIEAANGRYLYEVIAEWNDTNAEYGKAYYAFYTAIEKISY